MAGFFDTLFGGGAEKEAADKDRAALAQYQGQVLPVLQQQYGVGTDALNKAIAGYTPLASLGATYSGGANTLMDALGVNGPAGTTRAQGAFTSSPGYQWQLSQGLDALNRRRGAGYMYGSGNADIDAMTYGQGLASQDYQNWLKNLQSTGQMGLGATQAAAAGQAGGYGSLADLAHAYGGDVGGVYGNVTQGNVAANNLQAAGEAAGAKNLLGAGLSLASLALGPAGAGLGGSLGSLIGGMGSGAAMGTMQVGNQLFPKFG